jgi:hypothetical protein
VTSPVFTSTNDSSAVLLVRRVQRGIVWREVERFGILAGFQLAHDLAGRKIDHADAVGCAIRGRQLRFIHAGPGDWRTRKRDEQLRPVARQAEAPRPLADGQAAGDLTRAEVNDHDATALFIRHVQPRPLDRRQGRGRW